MGHMIQLEHCTEQCNDIRCCTRKKPVYTLLTSTGQGDSEMGHCSKESEQIHKKVRMNNGHWWWIKSGRNHFQRLKVTWYLVPTKIAIDGKYESVRSVSENFVVSDSEYSRTVKWLHTKTLIHFSRHMCTRYRKLLLRNSSFRYIILSTDKLESLTLHNFSIVNILLYNIHAVIRPRKRYTNQTSVDVKVLEIVLILSIGSLRSRVHSHWRSFGNRDRRMVGLTQELTHVLIT